MPNTVPDTRERTIARPQRAAEAVLMVRPAAFGPNDVTRPTNRFQSRVGKHDPEQTARAAIAEFDRLVAALRQRGVDVHVFPGRTTTALPDEVFPNNWISTHPDGMAVIYPLMAWNRRPERRRDVLEQLQTNAFGFRITRLVDLSHLEDKGHFLEGTGSLAFDHDSRIAYASLSPRTQIEALHAFAEAAEYAVIAFTATDAEGHAIYHTNVMMTLGEEFAMACLESIPSAPERLRVATRLEESGREVIEFSRAQMRSFVGNIMQLRTPTNRILVVSSQARAALNDMQLEALARHAEEIVTVDIANIESHGGGSVRCMLAELLLPRKSGPDGLVPSG
jgi:hypothetical protein